MPMNPGNQYGVGISPEQIQQMMQAGIVPDKNEALAKQLEYQQALRARPQPGGNSVRGIYQASSPLQHIGDFMQKRNAINESRSINEQMDKNRQAQADARSQYMSMLLRAGLAAGTGGASAAAPIP